MNNQDDDFQGLNELGLFPQALEEARQARIQARRVIDDMHPLHINSWAELLDRLKNALDEARVSAIALQTIVVAPLQPPSNQPISSLRKILARFSLERKLFLTFLAEVFLHPTKFSRIGINREDGSIVVQREV